MLMPMPPPNLQPEFEEQAKTFVDGVLDKVLSGTDQKEDGDE